MKKNFIGVAVLSLLLVGCAQNETFDKFEQSNEIRFNSYTGITRASEVANTAATGVTAINEFGVLGFTSDNSAITNLNNMKYAGSVPSTWAPSPTASLTASWPVSPTLYPVSFYAYYPFDADFTLIPTGLTKEYVVSDTRSSQCDYLAAKTEVAYTATGNIVNLNLKHIMSQIRFQVDVATGLTVRIASIKLKNIHNKKTYNFANEAWTDFAGNQTTSLIDYDFGITKDASSNVKVFSGSTATAIGNDSQDNLMLIPQAPSSGTIDSNTGIYDLQGAYLEVVYVMNNATANVVGKYYESGTTPYVGEDYRYVKAAFRLNLDGYLGDASTAGWIAGKKYLYTLKFGYSGNGGYNGGGTDNYVDKDGNDIAPEEDITRPDGSTPVAPGEPLLIGGTINFTVNVYTWATPTTAPGDIQ